MAKIVPVRPPLKGLNTLDPFVDFNSGYARELTNYAIYNGRLHQRPAVRTTGDPTLSIGIIHWFDGSKAIDYVTGNIYDTITGATAAGIGGACHNHAYTIKHASIELLFGCREPRSPSNPAFTAWTFTTLGLTATAIEGGCSHKGRLYVHDGSTIEYSDIAQITGAIPAGNTRDYTDLLSGQEILRCFSVTVQPGNQTENVFVIFGKSGRVLVFQGDYPKATNWYLIGKFDMPKSPNCVSFVEIDGDIWVSTIKYAYWLRDLFEGGAQTAYQNSPSLPVETLWQALQWDDSAAAALPEASHSFYLGRVEDTEMDAIVCQCSEKNGTASQLGSIADYNNEAAQLVYFRKYNAWALWLGTPFFTPVRETSAGVYSAVDYTNLIKYLSMEYLQDFDQDGSNTYVEYDIETSWKTPYIEPFGGRVQKLVGVRPYYKNTLNGNLALVEAIFDYSDLNSPWGFATQSTVTEIPAGVSVDGSLDREANDWDTYNGYIPIGGEGGTLSLRFTQKPKTGTSDDAQMHDMLAANAYVEDGGEMVGG